MILAHDYQHYEQGPGLTAKLFLPKPERTIDRISTIPKIKKKQNILTFLHFVFVRKKIMR